MLTHRERIPQGCSRQSKQTPAHEFFLPGHHLDRKHRQKIMIYFQVSIHDPISRGPSGSLLVSFGLLKLKKAQESTQSPSANASNHFAQHPSQHLFHTRCSRPLTKSSRLPNKKTAPPHQKKKIPESFFAVFLPQLLFTKQLKCPSRNEFFGFRMPQRKNLPGNEAFNGAKIQLWSCNGNSELKARPSSWWFR